MDADLRLLDQDIRKWMSCRHYFYVFLRPVELALFRQVQSRFEPPVADFGCGDGFFASSLAPADTFAFGIDNNPHIVKAAQNVYRSVIVARKSSIDLPAESIGAIISNSVFEHLHDPHHTLRELHRILKTGGRLYATVTLSNWEQCFLGNYLPGNTYRRFMRFAQLHVSLFDANTWETIFKDAGFVVIKKTGYMNAATVRLIEKYHYFCLPSLAAGILPKKIRNSFVQNLNRLFSRIDSPLSGVVTSESDHDNISEPHYSESTSSDIHTGTIASPCCFFEMEKVKDIHLFNNRNVTVKPIKSSMNNPSVRPDSEPKTVKSDVNGVKTGEGKAKRKKKIVFVSSYFLPYTSGAITSPAEVLRHFASQGHDITVLTFKHDPSLPDMDDYDGICVRRLPYEFRINKGFISFTYPFRTFYEFQKADVIIFNQPVFEGLFVIGTAWLAGRKIISLVNCQVTLGSGLKKRILTAFLNMSMSLQFKLSNMVVTYTQDYAEHTPLLKRCEYKTRYIPPLVRFQPASESFKTVLQNKKGNDIWVAFCGRISSEKGLEHLVHSYGLLDRGFIVNGRRVVLVFAGPYGCDVVGEESYYEKIRHLCTTLNVPHFFTGHLKTNELSAFYDVMDCLVLPSVNGTESFGIVQVEAMLHGKPVIASNLPGVRVPVQMTEMGLLAKPGDPEDLAKKIVAVLRDKNFISPLKQKNAKILSDPDHILTLWQKCIEP